MASLSASYFNMDSVVLSPVTPDPFIPNSANVFPKMIKCVNEAAWELWYFDSAAADGQSSLTVSFFRDARALKDGGWRVQVLALWPDGTTWGDEFYFTESIVTQEGAQKLTSDARIQGIWQTRDIDASIRFTIEPDLAEANIVFHVPGRIEGTLQLKNRVSGKIGLPSNDLEALLCPEMYYLRPISLAHANADITFEGSGMPITNSRFIEPLSEPKQQPLKLSLQHGNGGMDRCWSALSWPQLISESLHLRAKVGPYTLEVMRIISRRDQGSKPHATARLWKDTSLICVAAQLTDPPTEDAAYYLSPLPCRYGQ